MKKIALLFLALTVLHLAGRAQLLGVSGHLVEQRLAYYEYRNGPNGREIGHPDYFATGISVEANYLLRDYPFPITSYNGLSFTYYIPITDSGYALLPMKNGGPLYTLTTMRKTFSTFSLRFGYELPQNFNDFLLLHLGWGLGLMKAKITNIIPERSYNFPYDRSDFSDEAFRPVKERGLYFEAIAGGTYEFEHFFIIAQYSVQINLEAIGGTTWRHGLKAGILLPLVRYD